MKECVFINGNRDGYEPCQCHKTITVKELCDYLTDNFNEDAEVFMINDYGYTFGSITEYDFHSGRYDDDGTTECDWDDYRYNSF